MIVRQIVRVQVGPTMVVTVYIMRQPLENKHQRKFEIEVTKHQNGTIASCSWIHGVCSSRRDIGLIIAYDDGLHWVHPEKALSWRIPDSERKKWNKDRW